MCQVGERLSKLDFKSGVAEHMWRVKMELIEFLGVIGLVVCKQQRVCVGCFDLLAWLYLHNY